VNAPRLLPYSWKDRKREIDELEKSSRVFDLAVVGGGITGAAVARDAALRGMSVLLVEKNDFASGTSSRSSKLVHGGVRYLEHGEFGLVAESTRERALLWKLAPELVHPMPFLFPAYKDSRVPLWKLSAGLWLYDLLALFRTPSLHRRYDASETAQVEPGLRTEQMTGSIFYWDGATNDALLTLANVLDARAHGACALPRVELEGVEWNSNEARSPGGHRLRLKDLRGGKGFDARARVVCCAAGPWTDFLPGLWPEGEGPGAGKPRLLATTRGSHIVVPASRLPTKHAVVLVHPKDGRVLFSIPWADATILGTTDLFDREAPDSVAISTEEVDYLIDAGNHYYPAAKLRREDVLSTWSGLRPLLAPPENASESEISREHHIEWREPGLVVVAGGKLTTHREMAEQVLARVELETKTWKPAPGPVYSRTRTKEEPLPLLGSERDGPALPRDERLAEICRSQIVLSIEDLFVRRTDVFYREPTNGWSQLPRLKGLLMAELGWSEEDWTREVEAYRGYLRRNIWAPLDRPEGA
jgi:glycerol-3-phosphate dehydrogenase